MATTSRRELINKALTASETGEKRSLEPRSQNFLGFIKATSVHAATTVAAKIQHSPNGDDWFDVVSFTNIVGADGSEIKDITANTGKMFANVRAVVTLSGATQQATVEVALWFDENK
jgi:hypothetical protein